MGGSILNCQGIHVSNKLIQFFDVFFGQADDSDTYILIADEPTTALDVTIQAQILSMICDLQRKYGTSVIMITHDLGVVAETCDKVGIIYAGETVELAVWRTFSQEKSIIRIRRGCLVPFLIWRTMNADCIRLKV